VVLLSLEDFLMDGLFNFWVRGFVRGSVPSAADLVTCVRGGIFFLVV